ncbi:hypothetical protein G7Y89_g11011 [Cudoniella acicularis]|uniref:3-beta hydroxysteroid dehydrogenase/isomerase domain-containing protein n=1 Tax=Cudoniella acicularis TaxID=354080 RepID=A0A8H4RDZ5_9HELO|nr:hypothetical protein G7Y89_g11011 [Cudoniella acicularis]
MRMRRSDRGPSNFFSLRALYQLHSSSKKHHSRRHSHRPRENATSYSGSSRRKHYYEPATPVYGTPSNYYTTNAHYPYNHNNTTYNYASQTPSYSKYKSHNTPLERLPPELKHAIHANLTPLSSTMLGLSSPSMYASHAYMYPKTSLYESSPDYPLPLAFMLRKSNDRRFLPKDQVLDWRSGCGYLGSRIVSTLLSPNSSSQSIHIISRNPTTNLHPGATYHTDDIADSQTITALLTKLNPTLIIHYTSPHYAAPLRSQHHTNVVGTNVLLSSCAKTPNIRAILYTSSVWVVCPKPGIFHTEAETELYDENSKVNPYAKTKAIAEAAVIPANLKYHFCTAALRIPVLYDGHDD